MASDSIQDMTQTLLKFREARDWKQFHNPKDQILSLVLEAAEVLELVQWRQDDNLQKHLDAKRDQLSDELADVLGWILLIAHDQKIDLAKAFAEKQIKNEQKYPVEKARGVATKYTEL